MFITKRFLFMVLFNLILTTLIFADDGEASTSKTIKTAYFLDAPISGVQYQCDNGNILKTTESNGSFSYDNSCANITFSLNNKVFLGTISVANIPSDYKLYITDFVGLKTNSLTINNILHSIDTNNHYVGNVARLLQSLDSDETPQNGLNIVTNNISYSTTITADTTSSVLETIVKQQYPNRTLVSELCAIVHLEEILKDAGYYVDTVPPCKPKLAYEVLATSNDKTYIELIGERNSSIYINGTNTLLQLDQDGRYYDFELNTTIQRDTFDDFNITFQDHHTTPRISDQLNLSIFNDTDQPFINLNSTYTITHPTKIVANFSITDDSVYNNIPVSFEITGTHKDLFRITSTNYTNSTLSFIDSSIAGIYQITIKVIDQANHYDTVDLNITVN